MGGDPPEQGIQRRGHLQLATSYTRDAWFPALPHTTAKIKAILDHPGEIDREILITEVKRDAAVASALCRILINSRESGLQGLGALRSLDSAILRSAFASDLIGHSKHSISSITPWQQSRFEEGIVAVSTTETLSFAYDIETDLAFTCALLRQLGLSLLAWNYPHVFKRALSIIRPGETFEFTLNKILGFSPGFIAVNILRGPDASPVIMKVVGDTWGGASLNPEESALVSRLETVCKIGESMARATSSQTYPSSVPDWQRAQSEIEAKLGKSGWRILESTIRWNLDGYRSLVPDLFLVPKVITELSTHAAQSLGSVTLFQRNEAAQQLAPSAKRVFEEFYLLLLDPSAAASSLSYLLSQSASRAGFCGGAICSQDPGGISAAPRARFGSVPPSLSPEAFAAVTSASASRSPIQGTHTRRWMSAAIGETQRSAILYLEAEAGASNDAIRNAFRAVQQGAEDALKAY